MISRRLLYHILKLDAELVAEHEAYQRQPKVILKAETPFVVQLSDDIITLNNSLFKVSEKEVLK